MVAQTAPQDLTAIMVALTAQIKIQDDQIADAAKTLAVLQANRGTASALLAQWGAIAKASGIAVVI